MAYRIRNLIFAYISYSCFGCLWAQVEPPPLRDLKFHVVSGSRIHNVRFGVYDESGNITGSKPTGFRTSGRSLKYQYHGPDPIIFFEEEPAPTALNPQAVKRTTVAVSRLPENVEEVLFLFSINHSYPEKGLKYDLQCVDTSEETITPGHVTIYNTLPIAFKGAAGKKDEKGTVITATPGLNPPIDFHPQATLLLTLESKENGILRVYEDTITCREEDRILLVLFPPRFPGSLNIGSKIITLPIEQVDKEQQETPPPSP